MIKTTHPNARKKNLRYYPIQFLIGGLFFGALGCGSSLHVQELPETSNVLQECNNLETNLNIAHDAQADVLSPNNFREARESLEAARASLAKQKSSKTTLRHVATGQAYLDKANQVSALARTNIDGVVTARQQAIVARANEQLSSDFKEADEKLRSVTSDLEKNKLKSATKNSTSLQLAYLDLELRSIKLTNLNNSRNVINQAIKDGASEYAPQSLAIAEKSYKDTEAFITANRHEDSLVQARAKATSDSANHLLKITNEAKTAKKTTPEELALQLERKQNQVANKQKELNAAENVSKSLQDSNDDLSSDKAFSEKFERARTQFTKSEAEVYKQGNILTIRLRGLEFPTAQAVLKGENFPLLSKVQRVIQDFETSSVIVEGHTDSLGGVAQNNKLSEERALAVRNYFVSNSAIPENRISAVGYGFQKPIATNRTTFGRAQNRRVDVLIRMTKSENL